MTGPGVDESHSFQPDLPRCWAHVRVGCRWKVQRFNLAWPPARSRRTPYVCHFCLTFVSNLLYILISVAIIRNINTAVDEIPQIFGLDCLDARSNLRNVVSTLSRLSFDPELQRCDREIGFETRTRGGMVMRPLSSASSSRFLVESVQKKSSCAGIIHHHESLGDRETTIQEVSEPVELRTNFTCHEQYLG